MLIINGRAVDIGSPPGGGRVRDFLATPTLALRIGRGGDGQDLGDNRGAEHDVRLVVLHTTKGEMCRTLRPGLGPPRDDGQRVASFWATSARQSGTHLVVDRDGDVCCLADLGRVAAWGAGVRGINLNAVQIEIYQGGAPDYELYEGQLDVAVWLVDALTRIFGIQRQIPVPYKGHPLKRLELGGASVVGVVGHRNCSSNRGRGDPGDEIMGALTRAGYEPHIDDAATDRAVWITRQADLFFGGALPLMPGIPYAETVRRLRASGRPHGQWVERPGDRP